MEIEFLLFQGLLGPLKPIFKGVFKDFILIQGLFKAHIKFKGFSRLTSNIKYSSCFITVLCVYAVLPY
jgi:hypothetical protein